MGETIRAEPATLQASGARVADHAEEVQAVHTAADGRIEAAMRGWTGSSLAAMTAKAARWQAATTALSLQLSDHATALAESAQVYRGTETQNARAVAEVAAHPAPPSVSSL
ncbi:WXG100 family type VII secretion target [Mycobacterium sp. MYCO198283]|uniref:WXG100 family type VII secretion target n=1 Tax=Mycobacterium sp. MYCO198283 TaxID=2883505 RepID=UPI0035ABD7CC